MPDVKITTAKGAKSAKENLKRPFALFVCLAVVIFIVFGAVKACDLF